MQIARPPKGYVSYRADLTYFFEKTNAEGTYIFSFGENTPLDVPVRATVLCVAQWAERFEILRETSIDPGVP